MTDRTTTTPGRRVAARTEQTGQVTVLFVCVHNAGRSQLAAGLAVAQAVPGVRVLSAGTEPDEHVSQTVLDSLAELGIDRSDQVPRLLTPELAAEADLLVALKPGLHLPAHPRVVTWSLPDPADWDVDGIRPLRDDIARRVESLLSDLAPQG
ncbi:low molecular weight phosphatase family protein [Cellulomonas septica]|uniref:Low molecular weight phosphatase family protein n=1 Tax=Cellulomonas septica TaxID=285080 RepID=A0ABX1JVH7_9CELL|nr:low molecular weight phosphatase family protein [Cellulomonas septica]NKY37969.1 low molecular weight phosphatase family protein [Cellulomonas septica]